MSDEYRDQALDRIKYSVRASQAILQYGVGAMVDFQDQTLMTAKPESWENTACIHDERLEKQLDVTHFRGFSTDREYPMVSYVRFPRWYFCPKCRTFCDIDEWKKIYNTNASKQQKEKDPDMVQKLWCPKCHVPLIVSRVVSICPEGHIDDFPWFKWVHAKSRKPLCNNRTLTISTGSGSNEGLESISIRCGCGAYSSLKGAFGITQSCVNTFEELDDKTNGTYELRCTGFHPWKNKHEKCFKYPVTAQRGSSSVYFPYIVSSIVIPPYSSIVTRKIDDSRHFETFFETIKTTIENGKDFGATEEMITLKIDKAIDEYSEKIANETGLKQDTVKKILKRKLENNSQDDNSHIKFRYEEYTALNGSVDFKNNLDDDFIREETDICRYNLPYIKSISLIHRVREVRVLKGYTRCEPLERNLDCKDSERIVDIKPVDENWYPAYEVRGEGIFIEFDDKAIKAWIKNNPVVTDRANIMSNKFRQSFFGKNSSKKITAKFMLLHTISHLIIKEMSFSCGYNIASLQERLYCAEKKFDGVDMQGIFIYTAGGDSEGTLGGLVRQGRADLFPKLFKKAIESAMLCSNDPVCSLSHGQGRDSLNYAACHTCTLIPETSCEESNVFLDRATVIGDFDDRNKGFYSSMVYSEKKWDFCCDSVEEKEDLKGKNILKIVDMGTKLDNMSYTEIFTDLMTDADNEEKTNLKKILDSDKLRDCCEIPYEDAEFYNSSYDEKFSCELMWKKSKVMYFSECSEEDFHAASASDWKCFYGASVGFDVDEFLKAIMEV